MVAIVTRELGAAPKGSPLDNSEVDNNFINLNEGKSEKYTVIKNMTGGTITPGTVVYITGSTGANVTVALASASSEATSSKTFAIVVDTILNNETGRAVRDQLITGLDTSAYTEGSAIWLSTVAGTFTSTKPTPPNHTVFLGYVVRSHATVGAILPKILNGYEIEELHNVLFSSLAGGDILEYNSSTSLWVNATPTSTNTASRIVKRDASGNFSAGIITAALSGNASTATTLQTARTINGTSFNGSADITTSSWGTARTVTIGSTGKSVDGSAAVSWTIAEIGAIPATEKGAANGVATLGSDGKVPSGQLPSFVDDVLEYANLASFPATGETAKIYVALDTNKTYRWSGSAYVYITSGAVDSVNGMTGVVTVSTITGNAGSATALQTSRNINGTPFNGSADITTSKWGTARTITIGNTGKSVDGSGAVSWSLSEIGAAAVGHTHDRIYDSGGSGRFLLLSSSNELEFYNAAGTAIEALYLQYSGAADSLRGPGGNTILHAGNYNSYSPTLTGGNASGTWPINITGNADTTDGLHVHSGTNNEANKIVRTDGNGYAHFGWINTISGNLGSGNRLDRVWCSNDQYMRYLTLAEFKMQMGLSAKSNYQRYADYTSDSNYWVGSMGGSGYGANETFHGGSGFFDIWSGTNYPSGRTHIHGFNALHYTTNSLGSTGGNAYGIQVAGQYDQGGELWSRGCSGGSFSAWRLQLDSSNYTGYAVRQDYNTSLNSDTRNTRGVTRLYRRDDNSDYSVQHYWTGSHWYLQGFNGDTFHAHCRVGYADSAGNGGVTSVNGATGAVTVASGITTINYNNDSNSTYQMLWGSGNAIYGTGGIYCNPATDVMYASQFQATSDERLKTNWRELGEDFVRQLATVKHGVYDRLDIDLTQVGVSAQSLQRVLGESVSIGQDGMLSVNYGNAALVSSIQLAIKFVKLEDELSQIKEKLGLK